VGGSDNVTSVDETSSTDHRIAATGSASLDLDVPRPAMRLCLPAAHYPHVDVGLEVRDATLAAVLRLHLVVIVVEHLHGINVTL